MESLAALGVSCVPVAQIPGDSCAICLDGYTQAQPAIRVQICTHLFHAHCLQTNILHGDSLCPLCRTRITLLADRRDPVQPQTGTFAQLQIHLYPALRALVLGRISGPVFIQRFHLRTRHLSLEQQRLALRSYLALYRPIFAIRYPDIDREVALWLENLREVEPSEISIYMQSDLELDPPERTAFQTRLYGFRLCMSILILGIVFTSLWVTGNRHRS